LHCAWWNKVNMVKTNRYELADRQTFHDTPKHMKSFLPFADETFEWLSIEVISSQLSHRMILKAGIVIASLYITLPGLFPDRDWVASMFKSE
ncbi:hypothetical protein, partial [Acinetobacter baumannii]|uniref:hypothetical protein n=1 Tax=Acinetobacter baumannii TaxID=470 RepID=UPI001BB46E5F